MSLKNSSYSFLSVILSLLCCSVLATLSVRPAVAQQDEGIQYANILAVVLEQAVTVEEVTPSIDKRAQVRDDVGQNYSAVLNHMIKVNASNAIIQAVLDDYVKRKGIDLNQAWVDRFTTKFRDDVKSAELRAISIEDVAKKQVLLFQTEKAMFEEFGGRVIFRQSNPQMPIDAYRALLDKYQASGKLRFNDPQFASSFWASFSPPFRFEIPAENVDFSAPWWL